jgi:ribosomal protein L29
MLFQYMKYKIPSDASEELETFMRNLKSEYEALNSEKRHGGDVDDPDDSFNAKNQARIMELRERIEENEEQLIEWKAELATLEATHTGSRYHAGMRHW